MTIYLIKFIHLLCTLGLVVSAAFCLVATSQVAVLRKHIKHMFYLGFLAMLTGTLLIYPKQFSFHTPWIKAAYTFLIVFFIGMLGISFLSPRNVWIKRSFFLAMFLILACIIHDAVTKSTFLF